MSHYNIDYSDLKGEEKHRRAIQDIKEFWGEEMYDGLISKFRDNPKLLKRTFIAAMSFAGVQGYPAEALYRELWPEADDA